jgi:hypothetical protein
MSTSRNRLAPDATLNSPKCTGKHEKTKSKTNNEIVNKPAGRAGKQEANGLNFPSCVPGRARLQGVMIDKQILDERLVLFWWSRAKRGVLQNNMHVLSA